jgi:nicotinate-nucleotide--dimethylbenzimidazole phosphoribosyltransferase
MINLQQFCANILAVDREAGIEAQRRLDGKTKPRRSLGLLEDLACRVAAIYRTPNPPLPQPAVVIMAADHGVAAEGVSAYPQEVTAQMIENFASGGAASNVLARHVSAQLLVVDMGSKREGMPILGVDDRRLGPGTNNMVNGPAMSRAAALAGIQVGIDIVVRNLGRSKNGPRPVLLAVGEMGIANTTSASALTAVMTGSRPEDVSGRGTGIDEARRQHKIAVIRRAIDVNQPRRDDPVEVLAKLGGFEIAGLVGLILGAASMQLPVVLDGFITGAAALLAVALCPQTRDYCIAAHGSAEPGHQIVLRHLELRPLLDLNMRLGEATGALLAVPLVLGSLRILKEMATFSAAAVTDTGA